MDTTTISNRDVEPILAIAHTIKSVGRVPAGTLYAGLMSAGCTLQQYQQIESILIGSGLIRKTGDELIWQETQK